MKVQVNPRVLQWARTTAGLDIETAADLLGFQATQRRTAVERLHDLERGAETPSVSVLDRMAARYHRPSLVFYLPSPPEDEEPAARFRSAPKRLGPADAGLLNALVRDLRSRQELLRDALKAYGAEPVEWVGSLDEYAGRGALAASVRHILNLDLADYRSQHDARGGFALLRQCAQAAGALVLLEGDFGSWQTALDTKLFRGLSLADSVAPFVVINSYDATSARSFTLLHEMTHLVLGQSEFADLTSNDPVEQLCNDVAGDILLPARDVRALDSLQGLGVDELADVIPEFARRWRVSSSLVAYRAMQAGYVARDVLRPLLDVFEARWRKTKDEQTAAARVREGGPNYYVVRRHRLGDSLLQRTKVLWRGGELTTSQAAMILGVRAASVHALLEPLRG